jgi:hypothetical protein
MVNNSYPLVNVDSLLFKMIIFLVTFPMKNGDF